MPVHLQPVTGNNLFDVVHLMTSPEQWDAYLHFARLVNQKYVASNLVSMAQSAVYPECVPTAIYHDDTLVGFLMYEPQPFEDRSGYFISRLMIDHRYQHSGYGRAGMKAIIDELEGRADCKHISTSTHPEDLVARHLYESLGFVETGEMDEDEMIFRRIVTRTEA